MVTPPWPAAQRTLQLAGGRGLWERGPFQSLTQVRGPAKCGQPVSPPTPASQSLGPTDPWTRVSQEPTAATAQGLAVLRGEQPSWGRSLPREGTPSAPCLQASSPPPTSALRAPAPRPSPPSPGSRAQARAVNDCPARGPDPYLHSSAPGPARPPANLRPRHRPASPGARAQAEGCGGAALPKAPWKQAACLRGKPQETTEEGDLGF